MYEVTATARAARQAAELRDKKDIPERVKMNWDQIEHIAKAMKVRRAELIAQPLERIWLDLAVAALLAQRIVIPDKVAKTPYR